MLGIEFELGMERHSWLHEKNRRGAKMEEERTPTLEIKYSKDRESVGGEVQVLEL